MSKKKLDPSDFFYEEESREKEILEENKVIEKEVKYNKKRYIILSISKGYLTLSDGKNNIAINFEKKYEGLKVGDSLEI